MDYTIREKDFMPVTGEPFVYWWRGMKCDLGWNPIEQIQLSIANEMDTVRKNPIGYVFVDDDDNLVQAADIFRGRLLTPRETA